VEDQGLLALVPDGASWTDAQAWLDEGLRELAACASGAAAAEGFRVTTTPEEPSAGSFGRYGNPLWRRAVLATFFADLASYRVPVDQVSFDRLAFVMHAFPRGFRTYWVRPTGSRWWPVGYAGWYPMLPSAFRQFQRHPEELENRMVVPAIVDAAIAPFVYVFNYSVAPPFKGTALSKALVKSLAADLADAKPRGLACIAVSPDGCRIAERFGMRRTGTFTLDGSSELVFATGVAG
jgi:hypothetical protein